MNLQTRTFFHFTYEGLKFICKAHRSGSDFIRVRLDISLIFASFSQIFPSCTVHNTLVGYSDHLALVIHLSPAPNPYVHKKPRPKWFEPHWLKNEECMEYLISFGPSVDSIRSKLSYILDHFLEWSKKKHDNLTHSIKRVRLNFDALRS